MPFNADKMQKLRKGLGMTQRELAAKIGVPYQRIQEYEKGRGAPKSARLDLIADALETNSEYLLDRNEYPRRLTDLHYQVLEAFDRNDPNAIIDLLRQHLLKKGVGKKPIARHKPGPAK